MMPTTTRVLLGTDCNLSLFLNDLPLCQTSVKAITLEVQPLPVGLVIVRVSVPPPVSLTSALAFPSDTITDNPVILEDDRVTADGPRASAKATSVEPELEAAHLPSLHLRDELETHGCFDTPTTLKLLVEPLHRPASLDVALPWHLDRMIVGKAEDRTAMGASPPNASSPPPPQQSEAHTCILEEEWEIATIAGKRRAGTDNQYKVRWSRSWLLRGDLGNAQRLLQEFETRRRAHRGRKQGKPAYRARRR